MKENYHCHQIKSLLDLPDDSDVWVMIDHLPRVLSLPVYRAPRSHIIKYIVGTSWTDTPQSQPVECPSNDTELSLDPRLFK